MDEATQETISEPDEGEIRNPDPSIPAHLECDICGNQWWCDITHQRYSRRWKKWVLITKVWYCERCRTNSYASEIDSLADEILGTPDVDPDTFTPELVSIILANSIRQLWRIARYMKDGG